MEVSGLFSVQNLLIWFAIWGFLGTALMGEDKHLAVTQNGKQHPTRISERTLHEVALIGGFIGIIVGAELFHHKTSKTAFWWPIVLSITLWLALLSLIWGGYSLNVALA